MSPGTPASQLHVLAKPAGAACNLDCAYCFYKDKEALYPGSDSRMSEDLLDLWLRQLVESSEGQDRVRVSWQGGEPTLMGLDFYRKVVAKLETLVPPGQPVEFTLQTNGLRIDEEWARFLAQSEVLVGLSIDGPGELHDRYRLDKAGRGTFDRVVRTAQLLMKHGVAVNAMVTVHDANVEHPLEIYRFLRDELGFSFIQLIPIVERTDAGGIEAGGHAAFTEIGAPVSTRTVRPEAWGRFLNAIFDEWIRHDVGAVFIPRFEAALAAWLGVEPAMCVFRRTCGTALALEHQGDLYCCDHFVTPLHRLGNIGQQHLTTLAATSRAQLFGLAKTAGLPAACRRCAVRFACQGACPKDRLLCSTDGEAGLNWLCEGYKSFFSHIDTPMRILADLVADGRPAAEIMGLIAAQEASRETVGRNDKCPCGSGRKFKRCHG